MINILNQSRKTILKIKNKNWEEEYGMMITTHRMILKKLIYQNLDKETHAAKSDPITNIYWCLDPTRNMVITYVFI